MQTNQSNCLWRVEKLKMKPDNHFSSTSSSDIYQGWFGAFLNRSTVRYICSKLSRISLKLLAPVTTTLPETKIRNAILGYLIRQTSPGKSSGINCIQHKGLGFFWLCTSRFQRWMGKCTSAEATTFCTLNQLYLTWKPIFQMILAYLRLASWHYSSDLAPVMTILPELKIRPVVLGLRRRIMTAAKRLGLYSVAFPFQVISLRSSLQPRLTVPTTFWTRGRQLSGTLSFFSVRIYLLLYAVCQQQGQVFV